MIPISTTRIQGIYLVDINPFKNNIITGDIMDKKTEELLEKCANVEDTSIMGTCKGLLKMMADKDVAVEDKKGETYLEMAENLKPSDVSQVLQLALKIRESGDITDVELKNEASRLIRAIEMS